MSVHPTTLPYTLYGAEFSLYSGKVRAYLTYKNIPFMEKLATVSVYKNIIIPKTGVKYIPVLQTPDEQYLQDTTSIIDYLEKCHPHKSIAPNTPKQQLVSLLLELYGDEWLILPAMHYRWQYDSDPFAFQEFGGLVMPRAPKFIKRLIGKFLGSKFKSFVPKLGITADTIPALETWYETEFLVNLDKHFSQHDFLLGDVPCMGDFGFYGPLYAHLGRDPYAKTLMQRLAPNVSYWVERMKNSKDINGSFIDNDEIPATLLPILQHMFTDHWPILEDTAGYIATWFETEQIKRNTENNEVSKSPQSPYFVPRILAEHDFVIGGKQGKRCVLSFSQWMMQRPLNFYHSLNEQEKNSVDTLLEEVSAKSAMQFKIKYPLEKQHNRFVVVMN